MQIHTIVVFQKNQEEILRKFRFWKTVEPWFGSRVRRVEDNANRKVNIIVKNRKLGKI